MSDHLAVLESVEATLECLDNPGYHATFPRFELKEREALRAAIALMRGQSEPAAKVPAPRYVDCPCCSSHDEHRDQCMPAMQQTEKK